jgi:hypothetical protein
MAANDRPYETHALLPLEIGDDLRGIHPQSTSDIKELNDIEPPFAALEFRDERLRAPELLGQCHLRQACATTRFRQDLAEVLVLPAERRFGHRRSLLS